MNFADESLTNIFRVLFYLSMFAKIWIKDKKQSEVRAVGISPSDESLESSALFAKGLGIRE